jgi:hypothetical protein
VRETPSVYLNGLLQRPGVVLRETGPSTGSFTLLFTPYPDDSLILEYQRR